MSNHSTICSLLVIFSWKSMFTVTFKKAKFLVNHPLFFFHFQQNHLIRGHGDELDVAVDILGLGNHPVLVGDPVAVLLHILLHTVVLRVEDVAAISEHIQELREMKCVYIRKELTVMF